MFTPRLASTRQSFFTCIIMFCPTGKLIRVLFILTSDYNTHTYPNRIPQGSHTRFYKPQNMSRLKYVRLLIIWIELWNTLWDSVGQVGCVNLAVCGLGYGRRRPSTIASRQQPRAPTFFHTGETRPRADRLVGNTSLRSPTKAASGTSPPFQAYLFTRPSRCATPPLPATCRLSPHSRQWEHRGRKR